MSQQSSQDVQRDEDNNDLEYIEDECERNQNTWLRFPTEFIRPAKMCSVNKFVQCVDENFLLHSMHHIPSGPEFVLVGHDSPSLPSHMLKWIWAMSHINSMQVYHGCVVPVEGVTEVTYVKKGREYLATGIKRRIAISQAWQIDDQLRYERCFSDDPSDEDGLRETMMMESISELRMGHNHYADVSPIQLLWGIVPVEYSLNDTKIRRIFHILKTIPAPGFDLMRCLSDMRKKADQKLRGNVTYSAVLQAVHEVINYECNRNLNIVGFFGRSHPLPHPCTVMDDPSSPMNPQAVLSPFLVMRKIILQLPVSELRDLVIDGFPKTLDPAQRQMCFRLFKDLQIAYRKRLAFYHQVFSEAIGVRGPILPTRLPLVLCTKEDECIDRVTCHMNMTFNLAKWLDGSSGMLDRVELLRMPQLAVATLTPFQYVTICDASPADFIRVHIGDAGEDLDETKLHQKYSLDSGSWGDMPHAGMYRSARDSFRASLKTMHQNNEEIGTRIATYENFIRAQSTIHTQAVLVDLMMSDRVLHCAQCLDRLSGRINEGIRSAMFRSGIAFSMCLLSHRVFYVL
jgi:hypothetical protein